MRGPYGPAWEFIVHVQVALCSGLVEYGYLWTAGYYKEALPGTYWFAAKDTARALERRGKDCTGLSEPPFDVTTDWDRFRAYVRSKLWELLPHGAEVDDALRSELGCNPALEMLPEDLQVARDTVGKWADGLARLQNREAFRALAPLKPDKGKQLDDLSPAARALALLTDHPGWSVTKLAKALGVHRSTIHRSDKFATVRKFLELRKQGRNTFPRGSKDPETGKLEAWRNDDKGDESG